MDDLTSWSVTLRDAPFIPAPACWAISGVYPNRPQGEQRFARESPFIFWPTKLDMFNAPRPAQPYGSVGGSFVDENPLASSVYDDGLDPWSAAPSPSPPPAPAAQNPNGQSLFKAVICTSFFYWSSLGNWVDWTDFVGYLGLLVSRLCLR